MMEKITSRGASQFELFHQMVLGWSNQGTCVGHV